MKDGSFVTEIVAPYICRECSKQFPASSMGRPAKFCSTACRMVHHRKSRLPKDVLRGCKVRLRNGETGLVYTTDPENGIVRVALQTPSGGRKWIEQPETEVLVLAAPKPLPIWVRGRDRSWAYRFPYTWIDSPEAFMPGVPMPMVRTYLTTHAGYRRKRRDWSQMIEYKLAKYIFEAARGEVCL
jgi:hypothetical protein